MSEVKKDIWYYWKNLTQKKVHPDDLTEDELSGYNIFLMNKLVSTIHIYLPDVAELTKYNLSKEMHYRYLYFLLPNNYIKTTFLKSKTKYEDEKWVGKYFEFGSNDIRYAMRILKDEDIRNIKKKYGKSNDKIQ